MTKTLIGASVALGFAASVLADVQFIAYGWDVLRSSPANILKNVEAWDGVPVDGVVFSLTARTPDGQVFKHRNVTTGKGWSYEAFADQVAVFRELRKHRPFRHSLVGTMFQYSKNARLDWTDDAAWATFAKNMGILARVVRESGLEGMCIDNEDYGRIKQFYRKDGELPYDELRILARRRGKEVFSEVFREKPDMRLLAFWFLTYDIDYLTAPDLMAKEREKEDLWPAFIEGMLEAMPEQARFFDGNEKSYYYHAESGDYHRSAVRVLSRLPKLLEEPYRTKYLTKIGVSHAFYLDAYTCTNSSSYFYQPPAESGTQVDRLSDNLAQAAESAADGYIWFYGEKNPWIDWQWNGEQSKKNKNFLAFLGKPTWDKSLPGFHDVLRRVRNPTEFAKEKFAELDRAGNREGNLFPNGDFRLENLKNWPKTFDSWQDRKSKGKIAIDPTVGYGDSASMCLEDVKRGCFMACVNDLQPGQTLIVRARAKGEKVSGTAYYTKGGKWRFTLGSVKLDFGEPDADGWRTGYASVDVVYGSDGIKIQFGGQKDAKVWYDGIEVRNVR